MWTILIAQWRKWLGASGSKRASMIVAGIVVYMIVGWGESIGVDLSEQQVTGLTGIVALLLAGSVGDSMRPLEPRDEDGRPRPPREW